MKWEGKFPPAPPANKKFDYDALAEIRRIHREFEARKWAARIYWLEALPRALVGVASREIEEIEQ
jgi:hypothetical protein